ncbi:class I SAM-dependent methyltransferase [Capnocytophaga haemolytica]
MKITDYSVSHQSFTLVYNEALDLYETTPPPHNLAAYYESPDYISHTDGKRTLFERIYQLVKNYQLRQKRRLVTTTVQGNIRLLDIGEGTGDFVRICNAHPRITAEGVEPNAKARARAAEKGIALTESYEQLLPHSYDVITLWHVLEHIPNLQTELDKITALLKDGGTLIIAVPNYRSWDAQHYGTYWAAYDVPRHLYHFSKTSIERIFAPRRFTLTATRPMLFDAFYVSMLSEQYRIGKKSFLKGILNGLRSNAYGRRKKEYSSHIYVLKKDKNSK